MTIHFQHLHITPKTVRILGMILIMFLFSSLTVRQAQAAPLRQTGCTLPATVTTADQLYDCIMAANAGGGGTITLGADIDLTTLTTSPLPNISSTVVLQGAGYTIDGGNSMSIFIVADDGDFTVNQATLQNSNPGGIQNRGGSLTVNNSTFFNNVASAIWNSYTLLADPGVTTVTNSTFIGNSAPTVGGGAISNDSSTLTVTNSTFSGNTTIERGGAIYNYRGSVTATNNTFFGNSANVQGDAIYSIGFGWRVYLAGNIFVGSAGGDNCRSDGSSPGTDPIDDNGYNLSDDATCTNGGTGSVTNATLNLGSLANNGGPTQTHLPGVTSKAINAIPNGATLNNNGTNWTCNDADTFTDQRGESRPLVSGEDCTAGAVERAVCPSWTAATADVLSECIALANVNESPSPTADTITLGTDITLTSSLPQITSEIAVEGAGYAISSGGGRRIFYVAAAGDLTVNQAMLRNGSGVTTGGAIYNDGLLTVTNSTLSGNTANNGGAIFNAALATVSVTNSTFSGNTATNAGGAVYSVSTLILTSNTFAGNASTNASNGGSIYNASTMHLAGNIFAAGASGANCVNIAATIIDNGYNRSSDATCTNGGTGSMTNVSLNLGPLADNGGPTLTRLPGAGSNAIGAIPNGTGINNNGETLSCNNVTTDQIGNSRPINVWTACTSGAVEVALLTPSLTIIKDASPAIGTDFDFTINSAPLPSYSGSTTGRPFWTRPNEGTTCTLSANSVRYHVQSFIVDTDGLYNIASVQNYNGYIHLYQDSFNPLAQCTNYLNGDNDALSSSSSEISSQFLEAGRVYYLVTSGFGSGNFGNFTNNIFGAGTVYTLADSFTLDDAVPDDGDSVNASITFTVQPGTYTVSELLPGAWALNGVSCTGTSGGFTRTGNTLSVSVGSGEAVQCTFTNEVLCPASWIVTNENELAACIILANNNESPSPTADTITHGADITLTTALPHITSEILLEGPNHFIDGGDSVQLFYVNSAGNFTVNQVTLQNGSATNGGAIYNSGTLTVTDSTFIGNSASDSGGGIYNGTGMLIVTNSTFSGNAANYLGGGISNDNGGPLTVTNTTFSSNSANYGGGIYNNFGTLTVTNSTFSGNVVDDSGGGIYNSFGTLTVTNSTFSDNSANYGGGVYNNIGTAHLAGTILANSTSGGNCVSISTLNDNGYNLSDDASCGFSGTGSANNAALNLSPLSVTTTPGQQVHTPQVGSDAIGVIPNGTIVNNNGVTLACNQTTTDQLGANRPINGGDGCTSGAVEVTPVCTSWTVTTAAELADCIALANANESPSPTADTITLGADINLTTALPQITSEIMLEGAGHTIDGGWNGVPGSGAGIRIFMVSSGGGFTVNQVTLQNGEATNGGGLYNNGMLIVTNSTISGNSATNGGGGIYNNGPLTITNSIFSGNWATGGGGILNYDAVMMTDSTFSGNTASDGGGIYNFVGTLTVLNSTFSGNTATTTNGGGILNYSTGTVTNSTFSGNSAATNGGAIHNEDALTVTSSTFLDNSAAIGGGIYNGNMLHLAGTIFAIGPNGDNCTNYNTLNDNGYNLSDDASCGFSGTGSANNATLNLGALANNGGPTQTHLPGAGSNAIGAIPNGTTISNNGTTWTCNEADTFPDQRGVARPVNVLTACTAGAVEVAIPICPSWTATTANELYQCIFRANNNESPSPTADTITLGANITLSSALPQITSEITLEGANHFIDGGGSVRIFWVTSGGDFTVNEVTLQNGFSDWGGGVFNMGTLMVTNSTISGNTASNSGGGIFNTNGGILTVTNSTISGNTATDSGGGVFSNPGMATVTDSTISGNTAYWGGGVFNGGLLTITNSTFSSNRADNSGGGIYNGNTVHLAGTIFKKGTNGDNCAGTFNDNGYNLSDDATCTNGGPGSVANATLNLGPLANNGGPTQTHLPGVGSDAISAIPNGTMISNNGTTWTCNDADTFTDQRGESRPINSGDSCTAGAVEVAPICTSWTVTTAAELSDCITLANANESPSPTADTITLGADINLTTELPQITSEITLEGANHFIDGGGSLRIFYVNSGGDFTVNEVTLQNGFSTAYGGGIYNSGTLTVTDSTVDANTAADDGGGIYNSGWLAVINSTVSGNDTNNEGGGILNNSGTVTVTNSTFSGNSATWGGGGIFNDLGTVTVTNSTFSGNDTNNWGGGIYNYGTLTLTNNTFSGNSANGGGGGIYNDDKTIHLAGNVFAVGTTGTNCFNSGTLNDNGYNLSDDATCTNGGPGSATNATLNLGPLANNGGPTQTHRPGAGSDAIDAIPYGTTINNNGTSWTCNALNTFTDQRGVVRPQGLSCDSGAYEVEAAQTGPNFVVNTAADTNDGFCDLLGQGLGNKDCTLREAINAANDDPDASEITFAGEYTITLTAVLPNIATETTINGAGRSITVDGDNSYTIFTLQTSALTMMNLTLANGVDTITNGGDLTILNSIIRDGTGEVGGIYSGSGQIIIANSTFYNNQGINTGAIQVDGGTAVINNTTFSGNSGGLAGGVYSYDRPVTITNSIITNSTGGDCATDFGSFSGSNNLIDDHASGACAGISSAAVTHLDTSPANHGGDNHTIALLAGSNAINAGNNATCEGTDQRGVTRPINGTCDSGAYEGGTLVCGVSVGNTYTFPEQSGVEIHVVSTTDLGCLYVEEMPLSHPNATGAGEGQALRTGKYWRIRALQDASGTTANSYVANLTLPHDNLNYPKACKYTGGAGYGWECAADASTSSTVTRNGLTSFSDWAVGSDVGPTAVSLQSLAVTSNRQAGVWLVVLVVGLVTAVGLWRRRTGQSS